MCFSWYQRSFGGASEQRVLVVQWQRRQRAHRSGSPSNSKQGRYWEEHGVDTAALEVGDQREQEENSWVCRDDDPDVAFGAEANRAHSDIAGWGAVQLILLGETAAAAAAEKPRIQRIGARGRRAAHAKAKAKAKPAGEASGG